MQQIKILKIKISDAMYYNLFKICYLYILDIF